MNLKIASEGTVTIRIAQTGHDGQADSWTIFPHFPKDPNLDRFGPDDRQLIKSLSISDTDTIGNTDLDKKAEAISRLLQNLKDLNHPWVVVNEIDDVSEELSNLLEKEYGVKDLTTENERPIKSESKE